LDIKIYFLLTCRFWLTIVFTSDLFVLKRIPQANQNTIFLPLDCLAKILKWHTTSPRNPKYKAKNYIYITWSKCAVGWDALALRLGPIFTCVQLTDEWNWGRNCWPTASTKVWQKINIEMWIYILYIYSKMYMMNLCSWISPNRRLYRVYVCECVCEWPSSICQDRWKSTGFLLDFAINNIKSVRQSVSQTSVYAPDGHNESYKRVRAISF